MSFNIIRDAQVEAKVGAIDTNGIPQLTIEINGQYQHTFKPTSRESQLLLQMDINTISALFTGGTYVFYDDVMRDYRRGDYRGFIHNDDSIKNLSDIIGVQTFENRKYGTAVEGLFNRVNARKNNGLMMGGEWDKFDLDISELGEGGAFKNRLMFKYSVFSPNVVTSLEVERLICTNGMVGLSDFLTYEVPVISGWEDNLKVVSNRLKPEISEVMRQRFIAMAEDRATIADMMDANSIIESRIIQSTNGEEIKRLGLLSNLTNVERHLGSYYHSDVFNSRKSKFVASDLTQFDIYNILTEATSHTNGDEDNDNRAQRMANRLMFDSIGREKHVIPVMPESLESDPARAFFGVA